MSQISDVETLARISEDLRCATRALDESHAPIVGQYFGTTLSLAGRIHNLAFNLSEKRDEALKAEKAANERCAQLEAALREIRGCSESEAGIYDPRGMYDPLRRAINSACDKVGIPGTVHIPKPHYELHPDGYGIRVVAMLGNGVTILDVERTDRIDDLLARLRSYGRAVGTAYHIPYTAVTSHLVAELANATRARWPM